MSNKPEFAEILYLENGLIKCVNCRNKSGLNAMISVLRTNLTEPNILVLDLHNVTDLFSHDAHISPYQICVLSFVGRGGETRNHAREDISQRILKGQVTMGIMVFERPKAKNVEKSTNIEDVMGTKAWTINHMNDCLSGKQFYFVDDSNDHIVLTNKYLGSKGNIYCYLVDGTLQDAERMIQKINIKIGS